MVSDEEFRDLQERVDRLERVVTSADRDVAALQAQRRADVELLMALRGTQLEHDERLDRVEAGLLDHRTEMREFRGEVRAGLDGITTILRRLESPDADGTSS